VAGFQAFGQTYGFRFFLKAMNMLTQLLAKHHPGTRSVARNQRTMAPPRTSQSPPLAIWAVALLMGLGTMTRAYAATSAATTATPKASALAATCPASLNHSFLRLQDEKPQSLCQYAGKVLVVVNTASFCGYTSQYKSLEALHGRYQAQGLVVLGFPSNDFAQESGSNQQIAAFCENTFGVKFPMFGKTEVSGARANPFYKQLAAASGVAPQWNFHKYIIGRDGKLVAQHAARVDPLDRTFLKDIEKQLQQP
jgi:glutathione peroxidase